MLDHAAGAVHSYGHADFHEKNALALQRFKMLQLPAPVLRDLEKLSAEVVREESEKTPMARRLPEGPKKEAGTGRRSWVKIGPRRTSGRVHP